MQNNLTLYANSKEAHFKMLYSAFDIVNNINEKIAELSSSTGDNNLSMYEIERLKNAKNELLRKRIRFIKFSAMLPYKQEKVLEMRCEKGMSWKSIATALQLGVATVKQIFNQIETYAEKYGGIF